VKKQQITQNAVTGCQRSVCGKIKINVNITNERKTKT